MTAVEKTYDILDCGPRNRFVANGKLVHNSGGDKQNAQNLNRIDPKDPTAGALRMSLCAPPGHVVVVRDLGQIEARVLAYWAGQYDMIEMFRNGGDPYNHMASKIYGYTIDRKNNKEHKLPGSVGKIGILGCGYQMGAWALQENVRIGFMGMDGIIFDESYVSQLGVNVEAFQYQPSYKKEFNFAYEQAEACRPMNVEPMVHLIHCAVTKHIVDVYRRDNSYVTALWKACQAALPMMLGGMEVPLGTNGIVVAGPDGLLLPNGMKIRYHGLRVSSSSDRQYKYLSNAKKREWTKIYAGKMTENGTQALARIILSDQLLAVLRRLKEIDTRKNEVARVVSSTHDELIAVVPERYADWTLRMMDDEMSVAPAWASDLPLASSGGWAVSYGDCEK